MTNMNNKRYEAKLISTKTGWCFASFSTYKKGSESYDACLEWVNRVSNGLSNFIVQINEIA